MCCGNGLLTIGETMMNVRMRIVAVVLGVSAAAVAEVPRVLAKPLERRQATGRQLQQGAPADKDASTSGKSGAAGAENDGRGAKNTPTLDSTGNGISVGRPKVFDNRALTIMLEEWQSALRNIQLVDQTKLAAAFGLLQGSSTREVASNLTVSTLPQPSTSEQSVTKSGLVDAKGSSLPDTSEVTDKSSRDAFTPQIPSLDAIPAFAGMPSNFGQHPSDLLSDQVNVTYQIFNLRMLLERSLSDRLLPSGTRRQAVLGFNVAVDPPRTAEDAVAVVEIEVSSDAALEGGLSLVSLMPQEKTYNAAALSTKQNAFGGAAVAGTFSVGFSERRRGQTFYVYRDADTIAYERMADSIGDDGSNKRIVFGWMFRPVLGRTSVSPGLRQLFAVVALPSGDRPEDTDDTKLKVQVKTYWKKYDRDTLTSFELRDANRAAWLRYVTSLSLAKPQIFESRYSQIHTYNDVVVNPTMAYERKLRPTVSDLLWNVVGPKTVVISVKGNNFFSGTQVNVAGKAYVGNGDGLILKSNQAFDLTAPLDVLGSGAGSIIGRYGSALDLRQNCAGAAAPERGPVTIEPARAGLRGLSVTVTNVPSGCSAKPILSINGTVLPPPYAETGPPAARMVHYVLRRQFIGERWRPIKDHVAVSPRGVDPVRSYIKPG